MGHSLWFYFHIFINLILITLKKKVVTILLILLVVVVVVDVVFVVVVEFLAKNLKVASKNTTYVRWLNQ